MYTSTNYKTKKALKADVAVGKKITVYSPGLGSPKDNGVEFIGGPHYSQAHTWYAKVEMKDGFIIKVK